MAAKIGSSAIDRSLHPYSMCMWTNSDHPSGGRIMTELDSSTYKKNARLVNTGRWTH